MVITTVVTAPTVFTEAISLVVVMVGSSVVDILGKNKTTFFSVEAQILSNFLIKERILLSCSWGSMTKPQCSFLFLAAGAIMEMEATVDWAV